MLVLKTQDKNKRTKYSYTKNNKHYIQEKPILKLLREADDDNTGGNDLSDNEKYVCTTFAKSLIAIVAAKLKQELKAILNDFINDMAKREEGESDDEKKQKVIGKLFSNDEDSQQLKTALKDKIEENETIKAIIEFAKAPLERANDKIAQHMIYLAILKTVAEAKLNDADLNKIVFKDSCGEDCRKKFYEATAGNTNIKAEDLRFVAGYLSNRAKALLAKFNSFKDLQGEIDKSIKVNDFFKEHCLKEVSDKKVLDAFTSLEKDGFAKVFSEVLYSIDPSTGDLRKKVDELIKKYEPLFRKYELVLKRLKSKENQANNDSIVDKVKKQLEAAKDTLSATMKDKAQVFAAVCMIAPFKPSILGKIREKFGFREAAAVFFFGFALDLLAIAVFGMLRYRKDYVMNEALGRNSIDKEYNMKKILIESILLREGVNPIKLKAPRMIVYDKFSKLINKKFNKNMVSLVETYLESYHSLTASIYSGRNLLIEDETDVTTLTLNAPIKGVIGFIAGLVAKSLKYIPPLTILGLIAILALSSTFALLGSILSEDVEKTLSITFGSGEKAETVTLKASIFRLAKDLAKLLPASFTMIVKKIFSAFSRQKYVNLASQIIKGAAENKPETTNESLLLSIEDNKQTILSEGFGSSIKGILMKIIKILGLGAAVTVGMKFIFDLVGDENKSKLFTKCDACKQLYDYANKMFGKVKQEVGKGGETEGETNE